MTMKNLAKPFAVVLLAATAPVATAQEADGTPSAGSGAVDPAGQPEPGAAPETRPEDMPGWHPDRERMTAPEITLEGYAPVAAEEVGIAELEGAAVFGEAREHVGNVARVHLDETGAISHVGVDVGGFLGIGAREVEIGFDEMTILRDEGRDAIEIHVDASRDAIEAMPEAPDG
jgi:hypothetical protein